MSKCSYFSMSKNKNSPQYNYLVFTSAGDNSNLDCWLEGNRNFDLWVSYYGDNQYRYENVSDFYIVKKGGKFPALHYAYQYWQNILDKYKAIFVMDDDIIIDASAINHLFEIREKYNLSLLQPAFDPQGKISHAITKQNPSTFLRYTNFIEMTCPLFQKDKLDKFMKVYDPILVGWGTDLWFMEVLQPDIEGKVAIIDEISCINPYDNTKGEKREIDTLQKTQDRIKCWEKIKYKYNLTNDINGFIEYSFLVKPEYTLAMDNKVKLQGQIINKLQKENDILLKSISKMMKISASRQPFEKFDAYKEVLQIYISMKEDHI